MYQFCAIFTFKSALFSKHPDKIALQNVPKTLNFDSNLVVAVEGIFSPVLLGHKQFRNFKCLIELHREDVLSAGSSTVKADRHCLHWHISECSAKPAVPSSPGWGLRNWDPTGAGSWRPPDCVDGKHTLQSELLLSVQPDSEAHNTSLCLSSQDRICS